MERINFDYSLFLKGGYSVVTRDGIFPENVKKDGNCISGNCGGYGTYILWDMDGYYYCATKIESPLDLFLVPVEATEPIKDNDMNIWHVLPLNDSQEHIKHCVIRPIGLPYCECKCKPEHEEVEGGMIVVHGAFDGRLGVEWANEILNKK